jgi:hypothetical protein
VTNGQLYYYAVTAYDYGSDVLDFYPSENAIAVSRTARGGLVLPPNVVAVRANPKVPGHVPAEAGEATQISGDGTGNVSVLVTNSDLVPDDHVFEVVFSAPSSDSIRASTYALVDSTSGETFFDTGDDFDGLGVGPVGSGLLPIVETQRVTTVDTTGTGFRSGSPTNVGLQIEYLNVLDRNLRRTGYPSDLSIVFDDVIVDTSVAIPPTPANPAKFRVFAHGPEGDRQLDFRFFDSDGDGTLNRLSEFVHVVTPVPGHPAPLTWSVKLDTTGLGDESIVPPAKGDVFDLALTTPLGDGDVFVFETRGAYIDQDAARAGFSSGPYVVPNPYVGSASFEPERFAVSGRGERRIEFRNLPASCTVRIYTIKGEIVQTLRHDGSNDGYVAWNLRTKDNLDVAPGLYIVHVDAGPLGESIGKFAVIK